MSDPYKIIVIGDSGVGKTCLSSRFCSGKNFKKPEATVGVDFHKRTVAVDGDSLKLWFWDTAGMEVHSMSLIPDYRNVRAVVFVYDVTKVASFQNLTAWMEECKKYQENYADLPKILVGNKCDCVSQKAVNTSMARKFARTHDIPFYETSAFDDSGVDRVEAIFTSLAKEIKKCNPTLRESPSESNADEPPIRLSSSYSKPNDSCCSC